MSHKTVINIAKILNPGCKKLRSKHFFKVEKEGHHPDSVEFEEVYKSLAGRFPEPYFKIEVTYWENIGRPVNMEAEERVGE